MMTQLLLDHQLALSRRVDDLEEQVRELRVSWLQQGIKRLIIRARGHRLLGERATSWLFGKVKWLRWS